MAHQLGGLPAGVRTVPLPAGALTARNAARLYRLRAGDGRERCRRRTIQARLTPSASWRAVGIPAGLRDLNVKEEDIPLASNALKDACGQPIRFSDSTKKSAISAPRE